MNDETRADLVWLLAQVEWYSSARAVLERCAELRARYGIERDGPDLLRAIQAAEDVLRKRQE